MLRQPSDSEHEYFNRNPHVGGYADFESGTIVLNPYSKLSQDEKNAVAMNEYARLTMRNSSLQPQFDLTPRQTEAFKDYGNGNPLAQRENIIGRIISNDPSALDITDEQKEFAQKVKNQMRQQK